MRCDAVIHELAVPTDERDSNALAEHVAHCPACAAWAKRAAGLDRLWDATRPPEPSAGVWDALWSHLARSLDASTLDEVESLTPFVPSRHEFSPTVESQLSPPPPSQPRSRTRRWAAIGLIGLAQAAAVLLAVGLYQQSVVRFQPPQVALVTDPVSPPPSASHPTIAVATDAFATVVEEGSVVVIHADPNPQATGQIPTVVESWGFNVPFDDWYYAFNAVEGIASNPMVAMTE